MAAVITDVVSSTDVKKDTKDVAKSQEAPNSTDSAAPAKTEQTKNVEVEQKPVIALATNGNSTGQKEEVALKVPIEPSVDYILIDDDGQNDPPLFPTPPEVVLCTTTLHSPQSIAQPSSGEIRLVLTSQILSTSVIPVPVNLPNLAGRSFLHTQPSVWFDCKKVHITNSLKMELGPYVASISRSGAIQIRGKMPSKEVANEALQHVLSCARLSGEPLKTKEPLKLTAVAANAAVGRTILMPKLARQPGACNTKDAKGKNAHVDIISEADPEAKVSVWSTGKIQVTGPSRLRVQNAFLEAMHKIRLCVVATSGDHSRKRSMDAAEVAAGRSSKGARQLSTGNGNSGGGASVSMPPAPTPAMDATTTAPQINSNDNDTHSALAPPVLLAPTQETPAAPPDATAALPTLTSQSLVLAPAQPMDVDKNDSSSEEDELVDA